MLLCMLAKQHRKMMAGGTAQMPSCPAPPIPGRAHPARGGRCVPGETAEQCVSVWKGSEQQQLQRGWDLCGQEGCHPLDKAHWWKLKPIVFSIFHVLPLGRPKNEWVVRDSNNVKSLSVDTILKSLKHNLKLNAIHVFPRNIWMNGSSGNSVNNFYEKSSQPSGTIWKPEVGIFVCNRKKCKRYVLWSRTRQIILHCHIT